MDPPTIPMRKLTSQHLVKALVKGLLGLGTGSVNLSADHSSDAHLALCSNKRVERYANTSHTRAAAEHIETTNLFR